MTDKLKNMNGQTKLGFFALFLGFIAIFAGNPYDTTSMKVNNKEIAESALNNNDQIEVQELADWLIKGNRDYRLIDLRNENEYAKYFIPGALNIQAPQLVESGIKKNEKIILYGNDVDAAQAWFILKSNGFKGVYILDGGIKAWEDQILFPALPENASNEQIAVFQKNREVSKFFGGSPSDGGNDTKVAREMPKLAAPAPVTLTKSGGKRKREGC